MTLISLYLATKFRLRSRFVLYVFGTLLIISTVYLRYHYFIDLVGGAAVMGLTVWTSPLIVNKWNAIRGRIP
jgi:membrane-associated phospholipid phosphatase